MRSYILSIRVRNDMKIIVNLGDRLLGLELALSLFGDRPGLSIIVTSYRRLDALYDNLTSLLNQDLRDLAIEIIVINNAKEVQLAPSRFS